MNSIKIGDNLELHCYKHNGKINSISDRITVLDVKEDYIVCGDFKTTITESDGSTHKTKEPAILFFYKNISILKTQVNQEILHNTELINNVIYIIKRATNPL